jgi:quercetin dioxygenase-like cupin family protein
VRVDFAPGYFAPNHTHPGEEIIYVIEGTLEYEIAGKSSIVKAGDVLFVPAGTPHTARNIGTGNAAELATYVVEKGKPLITLVQGADNKPLPPSSSEVRMIITSIQYIASKCR